MPLAYENKEENNVCSSSLKLCLHVEKEKLEMTGSVPALRQSLSEIRRVFLLELPM